MPVLYRMGAEFGRIVIASRRGRSRGGETVQEWARAFYKSRAWLETREAYAASVGWLCEDCLAQGLIVPGKVVHHVTPLTPENIGDPTVALAWGNLRLVCQDCHAAEHKKAAGLRYAVLPDGRIAPPITK